MARAVMGCNGGNGVGSRGRALQAASCGTRRECRLLLSASSRRPTHVAVAGQSDSLGLWSPPQSPYFWSPTALVRPLVSPPCPPPLRVVGGTLARRHAHAV